MAATGRRHGLPNPGKGLACNLVTSGTQSSCEGSASDQSYAKWGLALTQEYMCVIIGGCDENSGEQCPKWSLVLHGMCSYFIRYGYGSIALVSLLAANQLVLSNLCQE